MRAVVDTNVIVSAFLKPDSPPGQVLDAILSRKITVLYDDRILGEYREVLTRAKFHSPQAEIDAFVEYVAESGVYFSGQRVEVILPDEKDLPFLEVAIAGFADAIITGNAKDFRPKKGRHNTKIISPAEFVGRPN